MKIKVAAEKYPGITFVAARLVNHEWEFETIEGRKWPTDNAREEESP